MVITSKNLNVGSKPVLPFVLSAVSSCCGGNFMKVIIIHWRLFMKFLCEKALCFILGVTKWLQHYTMANVYRWVQLGFLFLPLQGILQNWLGYHPLIIILFWLQLDHRNVELLCHRNALLRFYWLIHVKDDSSFHEQLRSKPQLLLSACGWNYWFLVLLISYGWLP